MKYSQKGMVWWDGQEGEAEEVVLSREVTKWLWLCQGKMG